MDLENVIEKGEAFLKKIRLKMSSFEAYYTKGLESYSKKKYQDAVTYFKNALTKKNIQHKIHYNLALAFQQLNKNEEAIEEYLVFLEHFPYDYSGLFNLGLIYYNQKDYVNAETYFERSYAIKCEESNVRALTKAYLHNEDLQKVLRLSESVLNSPKFKECYYIIANVLETKHYLMKDFTYVNHALEMYLKLFEKCPEHFEAVLAAAVCYSKKGDWANSVKYAKISLDINPQSFDANNLLGLLYYCLNDIKNSIDFYEKAFSLKPAKDYKIYSNLAYAYEKNKEIEKAINLFKEMLRTFSNLPDKKDIQAHVRILQKSFV